MTGYDAGDYDFHDPNRMPDGSVDLILHIVTREEWGAELPSGRHTPRHPFKLVVDHFTYTDPCYTYDTCLRAVQDMQKLHKQQGFRDIKYNFLIGGDGCIYEGRGWHTCPSKALRKIKGMFRRRMDVAFMGDFTGTGVLLKRRLDIAFIGDFTDKHLPYAMVKRRLDVIDFGIKFGMVKRIYNYISIRKEDYETPLVEGVEHKIKTVQEHVNGKRPDDLIEKGGIKEEEKLTENTIESNLNNAQDAPKDEQNNEINR